MAGKALSPKTKKEIKAIQSSSTQLAIITTTLILFESINLTKSKATKTKRGNLIGLALKIDRK